MPTPEGIITGTEIWTEPAVEPVEETIPIEEEEIIKDDL